MTTLEKAARAMADELACGDPMVVIGYSAAISAATAVLSAALLDPSDEVLTTMAAIIVKDYAIASPQYRAAHKKLISTALRAVGVKITGSQE